MTFELFGREFSFFTSQEQWNKAETLLKQYFLNPSVIAAAAILILFAAVYIFAKKNKKDKLCARLKLYSPIPYLFLIFALSLFNRPFVGIQPLNFRFDFIFEGTAGIHETRVVMAVFNFLYYIPYGILLSWSRLLKNDLFSMLAIAATGFLTEALQSIFGAGVGAIEHVLIYSLGGVCGIGIYKIAVMRRKKKESVKT